MVASREVCGLVAEDRQDFVLAQTPGPSRRQEHIVADDARRDGGGDFRALQQSRRVPHRNSSLNQPEYGQNLIAGDGTRRATIRRRRTNESPSPVTLTIAPNSNAESRPLAINRP